MIKTCNLFLISLLLLLLSACSTNPIWGLVDYNNEPENENDLLLLLTGWSTNPDNNAATPTSSPRNFKYIFLTSSTFKGDLILTGIGLTGIDKVDYKCNVDTNRPDTSVSYKALMYLEPNRRTACTTANCSGGISEHFEWVLSPNQEYRRRDGVTVIGTTIATAGIFIVNSTTLTNSFSASAGTYWSGLQADWRKHASGSFCNIWDDNTAGDTGSEGNSSFTNSFSIASTSSTCDFDRHLLCVEQ